MTHGDYEGVCRRREKNTLEGKLEEPRARVKEIG